LTKNALLRGDYAYAGDSGFFLKLKTLSFALTVSANVIPF